MTNKSGGPIVVGSGPVGLTIALGLAHAGLQVQLIEAGDDVSRIDNIDLLTPELTGSNMPGATLGRTRQLGGGLNLWGGQLAWPSQREQEEQAPLTEIFGSLAEYGKIALSLIGAKHIKIKQNSLVDDINIKYPFLEQAGFEIISTAWLKRPKLAKEVWVNLLKSDQINIFRGVFINEILTDELGAAIGVNGIRDDMSTVTLYGSCVIIAAGTIETVRLLSQPDHQGNDQRWSNLPWLGRGFNDHLDANVAEVIPKNPRFFSDVFDPFFDDGTKYTAKLTQCVTVQSGARLSAAAMLVMPGNIRNSISELKMLWGALTPRTSKESYERLLRAAISSTREIAPIAWRYLRHKRLATVFRGTAQLRILAEQPIRWNSRISLSKDQFDRFGIRRAKLHWVRGAAESEVFLKTAMLLKSTFEMNGTAVVKIDERLLADPSGFVETADDGLHHAGGAKIGVSAEVGVVDFDLQVFGAPRLYCCGASVLPRMGYVNPTLLAMALGQRLVAHIVRLRCGITS